MDIYISNSARFKHAEKVITQAVELIEQMGFAVVADGTPISDGDQLTLNDGLRLECQSDMRDGRYVGK